MSRQLELGELGVARLPTPLSRATTRRRGRGGEAPAPMPWRAVVLAVDTARVSGWAISVEGKYVGSGEIHTVSRAGSGDINRCVRWAVELGREHRMPVVLVLESPWGGSVVIVAALGAARERWERGWRIAGQSPTRIVKVMPSQWRGPVLGREWVRAERDEVRAHELRVARALVRRMVGPDEAPAILIGRWAAHAARVGRVIGKRAQRASLKQWTAPR